MRVVILAIVMALSLPATSAGADDGTMSHPAFSPGRRVEITGRVLPDGTIEAHRIRLRDPDDGSKIEGRVTAIDPGRQRMRIGGFEVSTAANPNVHVEHARASLSDVSVGQIVEARGYWTYRRLHAARLRIRQSGRKPEPQAARWGAGVVASRSRKPEPAARQTRIESAIEHVDRDVGILVVLGRRVRLAPAGRIIDERTRHDLLDWTGRRLRRDQDDHQTSPLRLGDWFVLGGRIGGEMRGERSVGSDSEQQKPQDRAAASSEVLVSVALSQGVELYGRARAGREFEIDEHRHIRPIADTRRVLEAALSVERVAGAPLGFQIGRQRFTDARAWLLDEYLDAATVHLTLSSWRFEAAVATAIFAGPETERARREQRHLIGSMSRRLGQRSSATAILVARDDRNRGERPLWVGTTVFGRPGGFRYWGNVAVRRGRAGPIELEGWALDGAVAYRSRLPAAPSIIAGFAAASGDDSRSDGVDSAFRQTALHSNAARFHGLKRFAYYGEVFGPELSNIEIVTGGTSITPFDGASMDVVYHRYRQRLIRRSLGSNALRATGNGGSEELGEEVDLIVSVQRFRPIDFSVVGGLLWPGAGMASPVRPARY
jgi:hypothetical protein